MDTLTTRFYYIFFYFCVNYLVSNCLVVLFCTSINPDKKLLMILIVRKKMVNQSMLWLRKLTAKEGCSVIAAQ